MATAGRLACPSFSGLGPWSVNIGKLATAAGGIHLRRGPETAANYWNTKKLMEGPKLSDGAKRAILMLGDGIMLPSALWASVVLRYGEIDKDVTTFWWLFVTASVVGVASMYKFGLYRAIVRYIGPSSMLPVIQGVTITAVAVALVAYLTQAYAFPRSSPVIFWFISILMVGGVRLGIRAYFYGLFNNYLTREPVAIYGAGDSGAQLAIALLNGIKYMPVAFIDDNRALRKNTIHGIRVYDSGHIDRLVYDLGVKQILLAVPSATVEQRKRILNRLATLPVYIRTIPGITDLVSGSADVTEIREIEIEDLLGRDAVPPDPELLKAPVKGKSVLVTGAGGTIGSELCRTIVAQQPKRLVLYDNSEFALYNIEAELQRKIPEETELVVLLGSVLNKGYLSRVIKGFGVQTVYHAAAYKHVPMVESNVIEGVRNNVVGTWNAAGAADENGVEQFVLISTDKAVRPTNVMGATKRLAELIVQAYSEKSENTTYCMVRFGNVLGSSGSVVPLFGHQIESGGPVTVTHKEATRFFMTASEAAELVIQAGGMAKGGELLVLDMGDPVSIQELAEKMIHLHGCEVQLPDADAATLSNGIRIEYVGLRPGEKLHEELIIGQHVTGTQHPKIMQANEEGLDWQTVHNICKDLVPICETADYPR
ncbi:MAG: polysaccharide biosynthesis protein, partial [Pseudomonadales bacterium]|nr:polysaccharide biosynthesis protein [Pseudomonadales bacterium]